jgi:hypothetical protein
MPQDTTPLTAALPRDSRQEGNTPQLAPGRAHRVTRRTALQNVATAGVSHRD